MATAHGRRAEGCGPSAAGLALGAFLVSLPAGADQAPATTAAVDPRPYTVALELGGEGFR